MSQTWPKANRGDPLQIPADAWNSMLDAAEAHRRRELGSPAPRKPAPHGAVLVRNETGEPQARYSVLGIAGPLIDPSANLPEFQATVGIRGVTPAAAHAGRFVILLEPLPAGAIGRACIDGVCPVRVEIGDDDHGYAEPAPGLVGRLESAETGTARILWVQPAEDRVDGIGWGIVRIGGGGGGGGETAEQTLVVVSHHGDPDDTDNDRVNTHWGRPIYPVDHLRYCPGLPSAEIEFAAAQGRGWFHVGQVVLVFSVAGRYRAICTGFLGVVTGVAPTGGGDVGPGCIEVTPIDGDPAGWPATYSDFLAGLNGRLFFDGNHGRPNGIVEQVATFPGCGLEYGELVWVQYVGMPGRHWMAWNMLDITGPLDADDYGAYEPPNTDICMVPDPDLGKDPPEDDQLGTTQKTAEGLITDRKALSITIEPAGAGTVDKTPDEPCYIADAQVTIHATPAAGYEFDRWSGDIVSENATEVVVMNEDKSVTAHFVPDEE